MRYLSVLNGLAVDLEKMADRTLGPPEEKEKARKVVEREVGEVQKGAFRFVVHLPLSGLDDGSRFYGDRAHANAAILLTIFPSFLSFSPPVRPFSGSSFGPSSSPFATAALRSGAKAILTEFAEYIGEFRTFPFSAHFRRDADLFPPWQASLPPFQLSCRPS